jgi:hypothetical protein
MTFRTPLLSLALSLALGASGAAHVAFATPAAADATLAAILAPAPSAGCAAALPALGPLAGNPPVEKATLHCGTCSDSPCSGLAYNATCRIEGSKVYKCVNLYQQTCSATISDIRCGCWYGPIP